MPGQTSSGVEGGTRPAVSYVMPVLNEEATIREAVVAILDQDYPGPHEVILALGPSDDRTTVIAEELAQAEPCIRLVDNPRGDIPTGLNLAIRQSRADIVVRVDAHTRLPKDYTRRAVATLARTGAANVGGVMRAEGLSSVQRSVARAYNSPLGLGGGVYHGAEVEGPADSAYLGVFRRAVLDEVGLYDTTIRRGEDWELNQRIIKAGHVVWFDPSLSTTYRPRAAFLPLARQMYATGVWRGDIARRQRRTPLRYLPPPLLVLSLGASALVAALAASGRSGSLPVRVGSVVYVGPVAYLAFLGVAAARLGARSWRDRGLDVVVLATMHLAWGAGFLKGVARGAGETVDRSRVRHRRAR